MRDKSLDLDREPKKLCNVKVTVITVAIGALGTIPKGFLKELQDSVIRGQAETIETKALLRPARILKKVRETWGDLLSLMLQLKTWAIALKGEKKLL